MTYSQAKADAYHQLDEAIENLRNVYFAEDGEEPNMLTGWVVSTCAVRFMEPRPDDPNHDDTDMASEGGFYSRRGQDPTLSYGIICDSERYFTNAVNQSNNRGESQ